MRRVSLHGERQSTTLFTMLISDLSSYTEIQRGPEVFLLLCMTFLKLFNFSGTTIRIGNIMQTVKLFPQQKISYTLIKYHNAWSSLSDEYLLFIALQYKMTCFQLCIHMLSEVKRYMLLTSCFTLINMFCYREGIQLFSTSEGNVNDGSFTIPCTSRTQPN